MGLTLWELLPKLDEIPEGTMFRWAIAGDLPGDGRRINTTEVLALARSVKRLKAWAYTHYLTPPPGETVSSFTAGNAWWNWGPSNLEAISDAHAAGLTVNLSADHPRQADELADLEIAPVVTLLPRHAPRISRTPAGRPIRVCPAFHNKRVNCATCGLCARRGHDRTIVGFPAHGLLWRIVDAAVREHA